MKLFSYTAISALLIFILAEPASIAQAQTKVNDSVAKPPIDEETAIKETIRDYIEGWYEGDAARMDRALHDELVKRIPVRNEDTADVELRAVTKKRMVDLTAGGGGETPGADYKIEVNHVYDNIASGLVWSAAYLDYVQLVKTDDGWKIANILFRSHD